MTREISPRAARYSFTVLVAISLAAGAALLAGSDEPGRPQAVARARKPTNVLFMCPHGAGKSVLAAAYFTRQAKERGLEVVVDAAGTEPDAAVGPAVAAHLKQSGLEVPIVKPRQVTAGDMETSDIVVSLGCDLTGLPKPKGRLLRWDDVPGPGEDFAGADAAIKKKVAALVEELAVEKRANDK